MGNLYLSSLNSRCWKQDAKGWESAKSPTGGFWGNCLDVQAKSTAQTSREPLEKKDIMHMVTEYSRAEVSAHRSVIVM